MDNQEMREVVLVEIASWRTCQIVWGFSWEVNRALEEEKSLEEILVHPQIRVDEGVSEIITWFNTLQNNKWEISLEILLWRLYDRGLDSESYIVLTAWEYGGREVLFMERIVVVGNRYARTDGYIVREWDNHGLGYERIDSTGFSPLSTEMKNFLGLDILR